MAQGETKLLYPGLAGFYETMLPIAATLVRIVVGIMFLMHVSAKFKIGADAVAANVFAKNGLEPALMWAYVIIFLESVGGVCLIIGLFTRFCGRAATDQDAGGLAVCASAEVLLAQRAAADTSICAKPIGGGDSLTIAIRGGGPYSVDRAIGKEL